MAAPCCQGGENAVLALPRGPWGAEMVLFRFLGGPAVWLYQILMFLYEIQMLTLGTFVSTSHWHTGAICPAPNNCTAASRGGGGPFSQTGARRQWEVAPTSFPHMPVMKCKNMFGISSRAKASVFVNSFVLLMGQNMEWNILKISNWATEIENDAVSEEGQCRWGLKTQHKEFCQMLRRKLNASQLFCLDFPQHEIPIVSIFIYLPVRATCRTP